MDAEETTRESLDVKLKGTVPVASERAQGTSPQTGEPRPPEDLNQDHPGALRAETSLHS